MSEVTYLHNLEKTDQNFWINPNAEKQSVAYPDAGHEIPIDFESQSFWYRHRNKCIANAVKNHPPPMVAH
ncbi:MAG: hypothetical protein R2827_16255 [Bdellovibrionales bacterium]